MYKKWKAGSTKIISIGPGLLSVDRHRNKKKTVRTKLFFFSRLSRRKKKSFGKLMGGETEGKEEREVEKKIESN